MKTENQILEKIHDIDDLLINNKESPFLKVALRERKRMLEWVLGD